MINFIHRTAVFSAIQLTPENVIQVMDWCGGVETGVIMKEGERAFYIPGLQGTELRAVFGDFIIADEPGVFAVMGEREFKHEHCFYIPSDGTQFVDEEARIAAETWHGYSTLFLWLLLADNGNLVVTHDVMKKFMATSDQELVMNVDEGVEGVKFELNSNVQSRIHVPESKIIVH